MAVNKRGSGWQANFLLKGLPRVRVQFGTEAEAVAYEMECRAAHALGKPLPDPLGASGRGATGMARTIADVADQCERLRWSGKASADHLIRNARLFVDWCGPKMAAAEALTGERIDAYVEYRQNEKQNSGGTINRHLSCISVLVKQAVKLKLIPAVVDLPWQSEGRGRLRFYSEEEEAKLYASLVAWELHRWRDLFMFLTDTGARYGEARKLRWDDIRGRSISFVQTKNGTDRGVTATERVVAALERQDKSLPGPWSWATYNKVRAVWSRLRAHHDWMGEDTVVHTFRHTCASRLVIAGVDLNRVKVWMGHKAIATTLRYAHLQPQHLEELADVLGGYTAKPPGPRLITSR